MFSMRRRRLIVSLMSSLILGAAVSDRLLAEDEKSAPPKKILRLTLRGEIFESTPPFQIFGGAMGVGIREVLQTIRKAKTDDKVASLQLRLKGVAMTWAQLQALRGELLKFRASGKPAYCHLESAGSGGYILASACSEVSLMPNGILEIPGVAMELLYMKGLLGKLGIHFQELRMGRYKSAAESLTRDGPSEAVQEERHALLDEMFDDYVRSIAENRELKPVVVRGLIDKALFLPKEAKEAGLVDHVEYEDEFLSRIRGEGDQALNIVAARLGKQLEIDFSGFGGLMKLMNELLGGGRKCGASKNPKLALVYGLGPILPGGGGESLFGGQIMGSDEMVALFRKVRKDDTVKAVVFRIDSPGGSALASELIWREVRETAAKKPVVVSMGSVAASGGYYIACPATWIVAGRRTLTGSIGVIGAVPDYRELYDMVGLKVHALSRGKRAMLTSPYGELTEDGRELLLGYMREVYDDFLGHVADGRKLPLKAVESIAEGRVWTGRQAFEHGLIDEIGGLDEAIAKATELGGLPEGYETLVLPRPKELIDILQGTMDDDVREGTVERVALQAALRALPAKVRRYLRQMEWVQALGKERVFTVVPETVRLEW